MSRTSSHARRRPARGLRARLRSGWASSLIVALITFEAVIAALPGATVPASVTAAIDPIGGQNITITAPITLPVVPGQATTGDSTTGAIGEGGDEITPQHPSACGTTTPPGAEPNEIAPTHTCYSQYAAPYRNYRNYTPPYTPPYRQYTPPYRQYSQYTPPYRQYSQYTQYTPPYTPPYSNYSQYRQYVPPYTQYTQYTQYTPPYTQYSQYSPPIVDVTPPTVTITSPIATSGANIVASGTTVTVPASLTASTSFTVSATITDTYGVASSTCSAITGFTATAGGTTEARTCTYTGNGASIVGGSYTISATDSYSNTGSGSFAVTVDSTAPTAAGTLAESSGRLHAAAATLYGAGTISIADATSNFTFTVTAADGGVGLASVSCPTLAGFDVASSGTTASRVCTYTRNAAALPASATAVSATATDSVGNSTTAGFTYTPDTTAPSTPSVSLSSGASGVYQSAASVTATGSGSTDVGSGLAGYSFTLSGATTAAGSGATTSAATAEGITAVSITATDNVGNTSSGSASIRLDRTAPTTGTATISESDADLYATGTTLYYRAAGANAEAFTVSLVPSDGGAGLASVTFPSITGLGSGATSGAGADTSAPYSAAYTFGTSASASGAQTLTVADVAGNSATTTFTLTADNAAPTGMSVGLSSGSSNVYQDAASVTATASGATDAGSGFAGYTWSATGATTATGSGATTSAITAEGTTTVTFTATDNVGNTATATVIIKLDRTDPTAGTPSISESSAALYATGTTLYYNAGTAGGEGFTVATAPSDSESGVASVTFPTITGLGTGATNGTTDTSDPYSFAYVFGTGALTAGGAQTLTVTDGAANTATTSVTLTADTTAPSGMSVALSSGTSGTWQNAASVSATASGATDAGAGVAGYTWSATGATTATGSGTTTSAITAEGTTTVTFTATDNVGNSATSTVTIRIDRTAATAVGPTITESSAALHATGPIGNTTTLYYNPSTAAGSTFVVVIDPTDALSGVASVFFTGFAGIGTGGTTTNQSVTSASYSRTYTIGTAPITMSGSTSIEVIDNAANSLVAAVVTTADSTAPSGMSLALSAGASNVYQTVASVTVTASGATDAGSGLAGYSWSATGATTASGSGTTTTAITAEGETTVTFTATDNVGNSTTSTAIVKLDRTSPTAGGASISENSAALYATGTTLYYNGATAGGEGFTLSLTPSDGGAGIASVTFPTITGLGSGATNGVTDSTDPYSRAYLFGSGALTATGAQTLTATDGAGNTDTASVTLTADTTAPTTPTTGLSSGSCGVSQTTTPVTVSFSGSTDGGAGFLEYRATTDGSTPSATTGEAGSSVVVSALGTTTVKVAAIDRVGNVSAVASCAVVIDAPDTTNPTIGTPTISESSGALYVSGTTLYYNATTAGGEGFTVSVVATDAESGMASVAFPTIGGLGSGATNGATDSASPFSNAYTFGAGTLTASGAQTLTATDNAANTATTSLTLTADTTAPAGMSLALSSGSSNTYQSAASVTVTASGATDAGAGLAGYTWSATGATTASGSGTTTDAITAEGTTTVTFTATDNVGNTATSTVTVLLDRTDPVVTWTAPSTDRYSNSAFAITWTVTDATAGLSSVGTVTRYTAAMSNDVCGTYSVDAVQTNGATPNLSSGFCYRWTFTAAPTDAAGNATTANLTSSVVKVDTLKPSISWTTPSAAAYTTTGTITPAWTITEAHSGLASSGTVTRYTATLSADTCGAYSVDAVQTNGAVTALTTGSCYYWTFTTAPSDNTGNVTTANLTSAVVKADSTAPTTGTPSISESSSALYVTGTTLYYNGTSAGGESFTVSLSPTDAVSGVASVAFPAIAGLGSGATNGATDSSSPFSTAYIFGSGALTANGVTSLTVTDDAANSATTSITLTPDNDAPTGLGLSLSSGTSDVYQSAASVTVTASGTTDAGAGIASTTWTLSGATTDTGSGATTSAITAEGATTVTVTVTDNVGNTSSATAVVKLDRTTPTTGSASISESSSALEAVGTTLYYNGGTAQGEGFTVSLTPSDAVSGVESVAFPTITGLGSGATNGATDSSAPYSRAYLFGSGALSADGSQTLTVVDAAGNSATTTITLAADTTGPTGLALALSSGTSGTWQSVASVTVTASGATDAGSGLAGYSWTMSGATTASGSGTTTDAITAEGTTTVTVTATDNVGNTNSATATVRLDRTNPTTGSASISESSSALYVTGTTLYYNGASAGGESFSVSLAPTDAISGVASVAFPTITGLGTGATNGATDTSAPYSSAYAFGTGALTASGSQTVAVADTATNTATTSITLTADTTAPTGMSLALSSGTSGTWQSAASVTVTASGAGDAGSGLAGYGWTASGATTASGSGATTSAITEEGTTTVTFTVTDNVGNTSTATVTVKIDRTNPTAGSAMISESSSALYATTTTLYYNGAAAGGESFTVSLSPTDAVSGVDSVTFPTITGLGTGATNGATDTSAPYSRAYAFGAGALTAAGSQTLTVTDNAANATTTSMTLTDDSTAPSGLALALSSGTSGAWQSAASVTVTASGASDAGSGFAGYSWTLSGATTASGSGATTDAITAEGTTTITVTATDNVGNASSATATVKIDRTSPATGSATISESSAALYAAGTTLYYNGGTAQGEGFTVSLTPSDAVSGVASVAFPTITGLGTGATNGATDSTDPYSRGYTFGTGALSVTGTQALAVTDNAANTATTNITLTADTTAPTGMSLALSSGTSGTWQNAASVTVTASGATDAGAGIAGYSWTMSGATTASGSGATTDAITAEGTTTVTVTVTDNVGNTATGTATVLLDRTAPTITWTTPATAGYRTTSSYAPAWTVTDAVSGISGAGTATRYRANLSANTCSASYSADTATNGGSTQINGGTITLSGGFCYYWTFSSAPTDAAGNATSGASLTSAVIKVDTSGPSGTLRISESSSALHTVTTTLYYNSATAQGTAFVVTYDSTLVAGAVAPADPQTGILRVTFPAITGLGTGALNGSQIDTTAPYTTTGGVYTFGTGALTATGAKSNTLTNNAGLNLNNSFTMTIDITAPVISWTTPSAAAYRTTTAYTPAWTVTDAGSGVASSGTVTRYTSALSDNTCGAYSVDAVQTNGGAVTLADASCYYWTFTAAPSDNVGNATAANLTSAVIKVDATAPAAGSATITESASALHADGTTLYYNSGTAQSSAFTVSLTPSDAASGVASVAFPTIAGLGTGATNGVTDSSSPFSAAYAFGTGALSAAGTQTLTVTDNAANSATTSMTLTDDTTAPAGMTLTLSSGTSDVWQSAASVTVTASGATDVGSGLAGYSWTMSGATTASGSGAVTDAITAEGTTTVTVTATDNVGNTATATATVKLDASAPTIGAPTISESTGSLYVSGTTLYYNSAVASGASFSMAVTASDAVSGVTGVTFPTIVGLGTGATNGATDATSPYTRGYSFGSGALSASGAQALTATDGAGNTATASVTLTADSSGPTTPVLGISSGVCGVYQSAASATVSFSGSNDGGSGLLQYRFTTNDSTPTASTGSAGSSITITSSGVTTVSVIAVDNVGNTSAVATCAVQLDTVAPTTGTPSISESSGALYATGTTLYYRPSAAGAESFTVSLTPTDSTSGVASVDFPVIGGMGTGATNGDTDTSSPYSFAYAFGSGALTASGSATLTVTDNATNSATTSVTLTPDSTAPSGIAVALSSGVSDVYQSAASVTATLSGTTDAGSGIASTTWTATGATSASGSGTTSDAITAEGVTTITFTVTDQVGNVATETVVIKLDRTAPTTGTPSISESSAALSVSGTTLYYAGGATGESFTVSLAPSDARSGVASVAFPTITGLGTGATNGATDTTSPYARTYTFGTGSLTATGTQTLTVTDEATNSATTTITLSGDTAGPTGMSISLSEGTSDTYQSTASVTATASGATDAGAGLAGYSYTLSGATTAAGSGATTPSITAEGTTTVTFTATDNVGNTTIATATVKLDRTAPVISWATPSAAVTRTSASYTPAWTVSDAVSSVAGAGTVTRQRAAIAADACGAYSDDAVQTNGAAVTLSSGFCYRWTFTTAPTDAAGNAAASNLTSAVVKVDTTAPTTGAASISESSAALYATGTTLYYRPSAAGGDDFMISLSPTDSATGIAAVDFPVISGIGTGATNGTTDTSDPYARTYTFGTGALTASGAQTLTVTDGAGNSATTNVTLTPDSSGPTGMSISLSEGTSGAYQSAASVTATASGATDAGAGITGYSWTLSGATSGAGSGTTTDAVTAEGVTTVTFTVTDRVGNTSSATATILLDRTAPVMSGPTVTETTSSFVAAGQSSLHVAGTTLYLAGSVPATAGVTVAWTIAETGSGIDTAACPTITGLTRDSASATISGATATCRYTGAATTTGSSATSVALALTDAAGNTASTTGHTATVVPDNAGPSSVATGLPSYATSGTGISPSISYSDPSAVSGVSGAGATSATVILERTTYSYGSVSSTWTTVSGVTPADGVELTENGGGALLSGYCYRVVVDSVSDRVDNTGSGATSSAVCVDSSAPSAPSITASGTGVAQATVNGTIYFNPATASAITLYATTDATDAVAAAAPVHRYRLGESSGSFADSGATGGAAGTLAGSASRSVSSLVDGGDGALTLSGGSVTTSATVGAGTAPFAFELWSTLSESPGSETILLDAEGASSGWALVVSAADGVAVVRTSGGTRVRAASSPWAPSAGAIYHLAGSYDGARLRLYVDGTLVAVAADARALSSVAGLTIGTAAATYDDVALYDRALSAGEIAAHAVAGPSAGDSTSGVASVTFGAIGGATPAAGTPVTDTTSPFTAAVTVDGTTTSATGSATATNGVGSTSIGRSYTIAPDASAPSISFANPAGGAQVSGADSLTVTFTVADSASGVATWTATRERATTSGASCNADWTTSGGSLAGSAAVAAQTWSQTDLLAGFCYRWTVTAIDAVGNSASSTSAAYLVDTSPAELTLTVTGDALYQSGATIWFGAGSGSMAVTVAGTDAESGIISVDADTLSAPAGWTADPSLPVSIPTSPLVVDLDYTALAGSTTSVVGVTNGTGSTTSEALSLVRDEAAPTITFTAPVLTGETAAATGVTSATISWDEADWADLGASVIGAGIDRSTVTLQRQRADFSSADGIVAGACGGAFANDGAPLSAITSSQSAELTSAGCYRWILTAADRVGNSVSVTSGILPVDPSAESEMSLSRTPTSGTFLTTAANPTLWYASSASPIALVAAVTDADSGIASVRFGTLSSYSGGGGTLPNPDPNLPFTDSAAPFGISFTATSSTADATMEIEARNGTANIAGSTTVSLRRDDAAPSISFDAPGAAGATVTVTEEQATVTVRIAEEESGLAGSGTLTRYRSTTVAVGSGCSGISDWVGEGSTVAVVDGTSLLVTGMVNGYCYRFTVTATDNVGNSGSATSANVRVQTDATAPEMDAATIGGDCPTHLDATTVWFAADAGCSLEVTMGATDPETGVLSINFGGATDDWTPTTTLSSAANPATRTYTQGASAGQTTISLTSTNGAGMTSAPLVIDVVPDSAAPSADFAYPAASETSYRNTTAFSLTWDERDTRDGASAGSGIATRSVAVFRAGAAAEATCPADGGDYTQIGASVIPSTPGEMAIDLAAFDVSSDAVCYRFTLTISDAVGNTATSTSGDLMIDLTAPVGSFTVDDGAESASSRDVIIVTTAADAASGVSEIRYASDGGYSWGAAAWIDYNTNRTRTVTLSGTSGVYYIAVQVRDRAGNTATFTRTISLVAGVTPPTFGAGAYIYDCATGERLAVNNSGTVTWSVDRPLCFIPIAIEIAPGSDTSGSETLTGHIASPVLSYSIDGSPYEGADASRAEIVTWPSSDSIDVDAALLGATPARNALAAEIARFQAARESTAQANSFPFITIPYRIAVGIDWDGDEIADETAYPILELVVILRNSGER